MGLLLNIFPIRSIFSTGILENYAKYQFLSVSINQSFGNILWWVYIKSVVSNTVFFTNQNNSIVNQLFLEYKGLFRSTNDGDMASGMEIFQSMKEALNLFQITMSTFSTRALILGHHGTGTQISQHILIFFLLNSPVKYLLFSLCTVLIFISNIFTILFLKVCPFCIQYFFVLILKLPFLFLHIKISCKYQVNLYVAPSVMGVEWKKLMLTSIKIIFFYYLTISIFSKKSHNFKICYNISLLVNHGLWNFPISQTQEKNEFTTPQILIKKIQPHNIVTTG